MIQFKEIIEGTFFTHTPGYHRIPLEKRSNQKEIDNISEKLTKNTIPHDIDTEDLDHIKNYSNGSISKQLNKHLIDNGEKGLKYQRNIYGKSDIYQVHKAILKNVRPLGMNVDLYSGVSRDLADKVKPRSILHSPAHISVTHSKDIAFFHSQLNAPADSTYHVFHIHAKAKDKGLHMENHSHFPGEYETILPAGTKLKHYKTSHHEESDDKIIVHHFKIHSQDA